MKKENSRLFEHKAYSSAGILMINHFELCQKSFTLVNNLTNWLVWLFVTFVRQLVLTAWKHATQWLQNLHMR